MRLMVFAAAVTLPCAAQAQIAEPMPPGGARLPGIAMTASGDDDSAYAHQLRETRRRIERAEDDGRLTRREAKALRREARLIGRFADRYREDGLSDTELDELEVRTSVLASETNLQEMQGPPNE